MVSENQNKSRIQKVSIGEITPDIVNINAHSERGNALTDKSIGKFGPRLAGLLDKDGRIIDGNQRRDIYADKGVGEIEIVKGTIGVPLFVQYDDLDLSDPENPARELQLALHRSAVESFTVDTANLLASIGEGLNTDDWFRQDELDALLAGLVTPDPVVDPGADVSKADELQQKWQTSLGQIWQLGKHKLACGDCTDKATVDRLMGGEKAQACVTDPPFNVRDNEWDKFKDFLGFTRMWLSNAKSVSPLIAAFFADKFLPLLAKAAELEGIPFRRSLIWVKPPGSQFAGGQKDGFWFDFELIQVYGEPSVDAPKSPRFSVFDYRTITGQEHGAEKPTGVYSDIFINYTTNGGIIYEPFSGTGSNLMACESNERQCRAIEISPSFVAVSLERWSVATGQTPVLMG